MAAWLPTLLALLGFAIARAEAQHVFAHVLVGTTVGYTVANWQNDIQLAASFGIEAFALNIGTPLQGITATQVANAFQAAAALNTSFQLFFSFDYLGGTAGAWQTSDIVNLLQNYTTSPSYFQYQGRPFVSTFEGPTVSNVNQWSTIRSSISGGIYFVPDWSSQGPGYNMNLYDGAFSWTMWPDGPNQMTTAPDQQWTSSLTPANKTYMMGVSPWFYTDLPAYNKAWVWRGDRLWFDRWQETQQVLPQFVEIVSWNDWGECHYVSPIYQPGIPNAPNADATVYVDGYPHSAWLQTLPYQIAAYKHAYNSANPAPSVPVGQDKIVFWYRTSPAASGSTDCTGNCAQSSINTGGYQTGYPPSQILEDNIFAIALLSYPASVSIAIGNNVITFPNVPAGINLVNRTFGGFTGPVTVKSSSGAIGTGVNITSAPASGVANFNAFVGLASVGSGAQSAAPTSSPTGAGSTNTTVVGSTTTGTASATTNSTGNNAASTTTGSSTTGSSTTGSTTTSATSGTTSGTTSGATSGTTGSSTTSSTTSSSGSSSTTTSGASTPASTTTVYVTNTVSVPTTVTTTATATSTYTQAASTVTSTVSSPTTTTDVVPTTTTQTATSTVTQAPVTNTVTSTSTVTPAAVTSTATSTVTQSPVTTTATSTVTQTPVTNTVTSTSTLTQTPVTTTVTSTYTPPANTVTSTSTFTQPPNTVTSMSTFTQPPNTVTSTSTLTQPPNTVTSTSTLTQPPNTVTSTSTFTQPPNTVTSTSTFTQPPNTVTSTSTLTQPPNTVTSTSTLTQPPKTVTSTSTLTQSAITSTVTSTQSASTVTTTLTQPAITKTVTQPPNTTTVTNTVTQPAKTSTVTQPAKTVTTTVTKTTTKKK